MELLKQTYYFIDYTLQFIMWVVIGRVVSQIILRNPANFVVSMFVRVTDPLYRLVKNLFPFFRVPEKKKGTMWDHIDGCVPIFMIVGIYVFRMLIRIIVSIIVVNYK